MTRSEKRYLQGKSEILHDERFKKSRACGNATERRRSLSGGFWPPLLTVLLCFPTLFSTRSRASNRVPSFPVYYTICCRIFVTLRISFRNIKENVHFFSYFKNLSITHWYEMNLWFTTYLWTDENNCFTALIVYES